MLTDVQAAFLKKRRWRARSWRVVGIILIFVLIGLVVWLCVRVPNLINPFRVLRQVESGALAQSALETMAILLPLAFAGVIFLLVVIVGFGFLVFANERRYLAIIDSLLASRPRD